MSSSKPLKLPVINLSCEPGSSSWISTQVEVIKALGQYGCFEATYDKIPLKIYNEMYGGLKDLFNLPLETKRKNAHDSIVYYGYMEARPAAPLYEGVGFNNADAIDSVQSFTNLMWPQGNPNFCEILHLYIRGFVEMDQVVKNMICESFGLQKDAVPSIENTDYLFRAMVYKPQENETKGLGAHRDQCFVVVLHQNEVKGLEIQTRDGEWCSLNPSPGSFIVMLGDSFVAWSNGRLYSTRHRVVTKGIEARYSMALFSYNKGIVEAREELVDEEHPLMFKPFHHFDLFKFLLSDKARANKLTIKDYCGTVECLINLPLETEKNIIELRRFYDYMGANLLISLSTKG